MHFFVKDLSSPTIIGDLFQLQMIFNCNFFLDLVYQIHNFFQNILDYFKKNRFSRKESLKKKKIPNKEKFQKP